MSKSSTKTKTGLTMTDMTESTELLAFKRQKDGFEVTVKKILVNFVTLSPNPLADMDPPFADLDPSYQTFLLSIVCIIFGN